MSDRQSDSRQFKQELDAYLTRSPEPSDDYWTVNKFIELLKRHDASLRGTLVREPLVGGQAYLNGWLNVESLVEEINERERQ